MSEYHIVLFMFLANIVGMLLSAGAIYGAIRADIRHMHEKIAALYAANKERIEAVEEALNRRIDDMRDQRK
jgi:hypothetical protein